MGLKGPNAKTNWLAVNRHSLWLEELVCFINDQNRGINKLITNSKLLNYGSFFLFFYFSGENLLISETFTQTYFIYT
jgi:hypothetical protein